MGQFWNCADTAGKTGSKNGIHEVGGSIPPGSTTYFKQLGQSPGRSGTGGLMSG
jgi:hypothetical protein